MVHTKQMSMLQLTLKSRELLCWQRLDDLKSIFRKIGLLPKLCKSAFRHSQLQLTFFFFNKNILSGKRDRTKLLNYSTPTSFELCRKCKLFSAFIRKELKKKGIKNKMHNTDNFPFRKIVIHQFFCHTEKILMCFISRQEIHYIFKINIRKLYCEKVRFD